MESKIDTIKKLINFIPEKDKKLAFILLSNRHFGELQSIVRSSLIYVKRKLKSSKNNKQDKENFEIQYNNLLMLQVVLDEYYTQILNSNFHG